MQTVLLIFIVLFALAIGFFLGLFLLSLDTPLTRSLTKKEEQTPELIDQDTPDQSTSGVRKPSPDSQLILQVWGEEGKSPVYDVDGEYLEKEKLPREILNVITIQENEQSKLEPPLAAVVLPTPVAVIPEIEDKDEEEVEQIKMLSVVEEVNDILQKKLIGSPMAGKGILMMENLNSEIRFWVGLKSYNDVEEIPDPEVRQIIDDSVKEWERNRE